MKRSIPNDLINPEISALAGLAGVRKVDPLLARSISNLKDQLTFVRGPEYSLRQQKKDVLAKLSEISSYFMGRVSNELIDDCRGLVTLIDRSSTILEGKARKVFGKLNARFLLLEFARKWCKRASELIGLTGYGDVERYPQVQFVWNEIGAALDQGDIEQFVIALLKFLNAADADPFDSVVVERCSLEEGTETLRLLVSVFEGYQASIRQQNVRWCHACFRRLDPRQRRYCVEHQPGDTTTSKRIYDRANRVFKHGSERKRLAQSWAAMRALRRMGTRIFLVSDMEGDPLASQADYILLCVSPRTGLLCDEPYVKGHWGLACSHWTDLLNNLPSVQATTSQRIAGNDCEQVKLKPLSPNDYSSWDQFHSELLKRLKNPGAADDSPFFTLLMLIETEGWLTAWRELIGDDLHDV